MSEIPYLETRMNRAMTAIERIDWLRTHSIRWEAEIIAAGDTGLYRGAPITAEWIKREKRLLAEHRADQKAMERTPEWGQ